MHFNRYLNNGSLQVNDEEKARIMNEHTIVSQAAKVAM